MNRAETEGKQGPGRIDCNQVSRAHVEMEAKEWESGLFHGPHKLYKDNE